ncbi:hypothetical protein SDC9_171661 [bioreactor metagenome]|uniref:Uncharacterized protein n=1 Tax=bioreactor metagenome TaxID=1076179 RepID=A0A645GDN6_9ZZZZ
MRQRLPDFFRNERHDRMQQFQNICKDKNQHIFCRLSFFPALLQTDFGNFNVPVTENIPYKIIELLNSNTNFKLFKILGHFFSQFVDQGKNPLIFKHQIFRNMCALFIIRKIHQNKSCRIPDFIGKVSAGFRFFIRKTHIISGAVARCKREPQSIRTELIDHNQRINAVAQRF